MRDRLARLSWPLVLLPVIVLATACSPGHAAPRRYQQDARAGRSGTAYAVARPRPVLRIRRAPYRLPAAVSGEVVSPDGSHLLVAGGLLANLSSSRSVVRIDLRTGESVATGHLALPVHDAAAAMLGGRLLVFGGGSTVSYAAVQQASPSPDALYGALPAPRSDLVAVSQGKTAYLVGGYDGGGYTRTVLATTDGRHFRVVASLPVPVRYPGAAVADGNLWIFGGLTPGGPVADVQCVNLRTGRTRRDGRLPRPLTAGSAFTLDGNVYLAGGLTTAGPADRPGDTSSLVTSSAVRRFDPAGPSFSAAGKLPAPVSHAAVTVTGGIAYLVGGLDQSRTVRTVTTFRLVPGARPAAGP